MQERTKKTISAVVVSKSGDKSIKVAMDHKFRHPVYGKYVKRTTKLRVHDPRNEAGVGDTVEIVESRPYSKAKSWRLVKVVARAVTE